MAMQSVSTAIVRADDPRSLRALDVLATSDQWVRAHRKSDGHAFFVIPSSRGAQHGVYWTDCRECTCPDFVRGAGMFPCKHVYSVRLWNARQRAEQTTPRTNRRQRAPQPAPAVAATESDQCPQSGARGARWVLWDRDTRTVRCAHCKAVLGQSDARPEGDGWGPVAKHEWPTPAAPVAIVLTPEQERLSALYTQLYGEDA